jgi:hypothetical protein
MLHFQYLSSLRLALALTCGAIVAPAFAQTYAAGFPVDSFDAHAAVAQWMAAYDHAAWKSTDAVQALPESQRTGLGREWFCYQAAGRWHGVYGRYDSTSDRYNAVVHLVEGDSGFQRVDDPVDTMLATSFGRALHRALAGLPPSLVARVSMNQFVRRLDGGRIEVWLIPGWQPAGYLLHGLEWRYTLDHDGRAVIDSAQSGRTLDRLRPDTTATVVLDDDAFQAPRVASLFLVVAYGHWFRHLYVETQRFRSTLFRESGEQAWIHVVRQSAPPAGPS